MAARKAPGKGLIEKRWRILRSLDAHLRFLESVADSAPWTPPPRVERPARQPDPDPYRARPGRYYSPREKPELRHAAPGPEAITDEQIKAWIEVDPFVRGGLRPQTQRAIVFLTTFAPKTRAS